MFIERFSLADRYREIGIRRAYLLHRRRRQVASAEKDGPHD
jgi:hypothetical protein